MPYQKDDAASSTVISKSGGQATAEPKVETQQSEAVEIAESTDKAPQTQNVEQFGGALLAQNKVPGQTDDLLVLTPEEQQGLGGNISVSREPVRTRQPAVTPATDAGTAGRGGSWGASPEKGNSQASGVVLATARTSGGREALSADEQQAIKVVDESLYPSAAQCGECHKQIYEEWSSSNHAYASISPMFHKFEQKFQELTQGTVGTFCVRCHQQVGTQLGEKRETPLWERTQISREGISCITCHRVKEQFGKVNGERRVEPGKIFEPVYGSGESSVIKDIIANKDTFTVATSEGERGNPIHKGMITNSQITQSEFCVSCHQVAVNLGIKLEIVWDQYRDSPARKAGVTCQDCHMGKVPGRPEGYATAPSAVVGGKEINPGRKHADHRFIGPGYSIAHPGIFPHNKKAQVFSIKDWLQFNWRDGWGTTEFEDKVANGTIRVNFPQPWANSIDREDARLVIEENLAKLKERYEIRKAVMENGSSLEGPYIDGSPRVGDDLSFSYLVKNTNTGHNLPSGSLGAQPQLWLNVALIDPDGRSIWESGYVDNNGDMADLHSLEVAAGSIQTDKQLVHFQTKFLTTNIKGTDREMYLPVNFDVDQLPHLRPPQVPTTVLNHPPFVRMENHSLPPLGEKTASYNVPGNLIRKPGKYRLVIRMRSRAEPIYFMRFVGATKEMERRMNEQIMDFHAYAVAFEVKR